jgi:hypothetical protein
MLTGIHFLLSYECLFECDHCFVFSKPGAGGTFTLDQITNILDESSKLGTVKDIHFEGGEPFLFYPLMIEGIKAARSRGFNVGFVTNCYWATTEKDAEIWLRPVADAGVSIMRFSDDAFHYGDESDNPARHALTAAKKFGLDAGVICIEGPTVTVAKSSEQDKGEPVVGGGVLFKGRAADKLTEDLPRKSCSEFDCCPHEELIKPKRVHADAHGNLHICQGISMGNAWKTPLSKLVNDYDPASHPICGPLIEGGPLALAKKYDVDHEGEYVDACHFCFQIRRALIDRFPDFLAPRNIYGLE